MASLAQAGCPATCRAHTRLKKTILRNSTTVLELSRVGQQARSRGRVPVPRRAAEPPSAAGSGATSPQHEMSLEVRYLKLSNGHLIGPRCACALLSEADSAVIAASLAIRSHILWLKTHKWRGYISGSLIQELGARLQQAPLKVSKSRAQAFVATLRENSKHDSSTRYTLEPLFEMCRLLCVPAAKVCPLPLCGSSATPPLFPLLLPRS